MIEFLFLEKITVNHKLVRKSVIKEEKNHRYRRKEWQSESIEKTDVYVLGKRTLSNGRVGYYSDHIKYHPQDYIHAFLVIKDENTNPFYILKEV